MTKKLEELLNLPESKKITKSTMEKSSRSVYKKRAQENTHPDNLFQDFGDIDKIETALPRVKGLGDISDGELDALATRATDAYDSLMDLGMNVDPRFSGRIFEVASSMLKNAIDAKNSKIDKKLKMVELQLKKQKIEQDAKMSKDSQDPIAGQGILITDRNSLLEKLKNIKQSPGA